MTASFCLQKRIKESILVLTSFITFASGIMEYGSLFDK